MAQLGKKAYRVLRGGLALTGVVALAELYKDYKANKVRRSYLCTGSMPEGCRAHRETVVSVEGLCLQS